MSKDYLITLRRNMDEKLPFVLDLFCGCGGLSLGMQKAGFSDIGGVDINAPSVKTASANLDYRLGKPESHITGDLTKMSFNEIPYIGERDRFICIGGPPCQAYSRVGRGKLRSLGEDRHHLNDPRGNLYEDFIRLCLEMNADAVLMENVPEIVNYNKINIAEKICNILITENYSAGWTILNSADYGVPQIRERLFIIGVKKKLCRKISFPAAVCRSNTAVKTFWQSQKKRLKSFPCYIETKFHSKEDLSPWVSVGEAISDLPRLFKSSSDRYVLHQPNIIFQYNNNPENSFQKKMRSWFGQTRNFVSGHSFRKTARDFAIFEKMKPGDNFKEAILISEDFLENAIHEAGVDKHENPERYKQLRKRIVPPYSREKFHDKWKRLDPERPSPTVTAHLSVDTYSHIHPWEPRGITIREAARLQSFPDDFYFPGTMGEAFQQIGNAVPPLLAEALGKHLIRLLNGD